MKHRFLIILLVILSLSCKKSANPLKPDPDCIAADLVLSQTYRPGAAESFLRLTAENIRFPDSVAIFRNGSFAFMLHLTGGDTCFYDENLLPNTTYAYRAVYFRPRSQTDSSNVVTLTTMDTTGHDFSWEVKNFGTGAGSALNDVTIIDENNIWAVGEIHTDETDRYDSLGNWVDHFSAVHWNGTEWQLIRIYFDWRINFPEGTEGNVIAACSAIFVTPEGDIWIKAGTIQHYDGEVWHQYKSLDLINKILGSSSNNLYFAGDNGVLIHYNGTSWTRLHSGTDLPLQDIWGAVDPVTGEEVVLCVASRRDLNYGCKLLKIEGNVVKEISSEGLSWSLRTLWFLPGRIYYIGGAGLYPSYTLGPIWQYDNTLPLYYTHTMQGIDLNDIVTAGGSGSVSHYNGITWKHFLGNELPDIYGNYYGIDIKNNVIVAVGSEGNNDILAIGRRN